ncbi:MAG: hypothetical protein V2A78_01920 [bacterium]
MEKFLLGKPLVVFIGAMGSGKTEVALNYATCWAREEARVVHLADLDVRKPYFRSRDLIAQMKAVNVHVVSTPEAITGVDFPGLSPKMESLFRMEDPLVVDAGGDTDGARILGRFREYFAARGAEVLFVINQSRMGSRSVDEIAETVREIAAACRTRITGLVNNTHLMWESSFIGVKEGEALVRKVSEKLGLPIVFHSMLKHLALEADGIFPEPILPLDVRIGPEWFYEMYQEVNNAHRQV